jgi:hypothetical protein
MGFLLFDQLSPEKPGRIGLKSFFESFVRGAAPPRFCIGMHRRRPFLILRERLFFREFGIRA